MAASPSSAGRRRSAFWELLNSTPRDALAQATGSQLFRAIVENSGDLLLVVAADGRLDYVSPSVTSLLGYAAKDLVGLPLAALLSDGEAGRIASTLQAAAAGADRVCRLEGHCRHVDGSWVPSEITVTGLLHDPNVRGFVVTIRNVGERKRLEQALTRQAYSDALTGLPNRALFQSRVDQALLSRSHVDASVALLFCDLDGFKAVNDVQGHAAGDELLR